MEKRVRAAYGSRIEMSAVETNMRDFLTVHSVATYPRKQRTDGTDSPKPDRIVLNEIRVR